MPSSHSNAQPDARIEALLHWLRKDLGQSVDSIAPASEDASFRRYFRIRIGAFTHIVMDAPPPRENVRPFLAVAELFRGAGVHTPEIRAAQPELGFVWLSDFGSRPYLGELNPSSAARLYGDALDTLERLQCGIAAETAPLPAYDERLLRNELEIFHEWLLRQFLGLELSSGETCLWWSVTDTLTGSALEQPRACVHRDFHSRNLMYLETGNPGVLDFQDAVVGPIAYDLVSLLRDCYVAWPEQRVETWMAGYRDRLNQAGMLGGRGVENFRRWFDLMGMQRHLKAAGIFTRLLLRDGKPGYLADIPRTLGYVLGVCARYPELEGFGGFLEKRVLPALAGRGVA